MPPKKERLKVLPEVSVGSLIEALSGFCFEVKSRDLYNFMKPMFSVKWKGGPQARGLAQVAPLYKRLFSTGLAKNGVFPNRLLSLVVKRMVESLTLEKPKAAADLWLDRLNHHIRSLAGHFRVLKESEEALQRCLKNADDHQAENIRGVLEVMHIPRPLPRAPPSFSDRSDWRNITPHRPTNSSCFLALGLSCLSLTALSITSVSHGE